MDILHRDKTFVPRGFLVCEFYGKPTCFIWSDNKLVKFAFTAAGISTNKLDSLILPARIKNVDYFAGRVFIICEPCGIYKLWHNMDFTVLSKSGQGIGAVFHEVLYMIDNCLYLDNTQNGTTKLVKVVHVYSQKSDKLFTFPCSTENMDIQFGKILWENDNSCCIIGIGNMIFRLANENIKIIHCCENSVKGIFPIWNVDKISGLILVVGTNTVVIMHHLDDKVVFDTVQLKSEIVTLSAGANQTLIDSMWIVYSDMHRLYYLRKYFRSGKTVRIRTEPISFVSMQYYNNLVLGLSGKKQLSKVAIFKLESLLLRQSNDFAPFNTNMVEGFRMILHEFTSRLQEQSQKRKLAIEQDKLNRTNIYMKKQRIRFCPLMMIENDSNKTFLIIDFQDVLPKNTKILVNLQFELDNIYFMQDVKESGTVVKMYIPYEKVSEPLKISFDLVVLSVENEPWLVIKDYIIGPLTSEKRKRQMSENKIASIHSKVEKVNYFLQKQKIIT